MTKKIAVSLRKRWDAEKKPDMKHRLGQSLARVLSQVGSDERIASPGQQQARVSARNDSDAPSCDSHADKHPADSAQALHSIVGLQYSSLGGLAPLMDASCVCGVGVGVCVK